MTHAVLTGSSRFLGNQENSALVRDHGRGNGQRLIKRPTSYASGRRLGSRQRSRMRRSSAASDVSRNASAGMRDRNGSSSRAASRRRSSSADGSSASRAAVIKSRSMAVKRSITAVRASLRDAARARRASCRVRRARDRSRRPASDRCPSAAASVAPSRDRCASAAPASVSHADAVFASLAPSPARRIAATPARRRASPRPCPGRPAPPWRPRHAERSAAAALAVTPTARRHSSNASRISASQNSTRIGRRRGPGPSPADDRSTDRSHDTRS